MNKTKSHLYNQKRDMLTKMAKAKRLIESKKRMKENFVIGRLNINDNRLL